MKKGFTLIELLAVIVILAIIALIATPIIINIIDDTRKNSEIESIKLYLDSVQKAVAKKQLNDINFNPETCEVDSLKIICDGEELIVEMTGNTPSSGYIYFKNGKVDKCENLLLEGFYYQVDNGNYMKSKEKSISLSKDYNRIEYIKSNDRQWIDTNFKAGVNIGIELEYAPESIGTIFGAITSKNVGYFGVNLTNKFELYWERAVGFYSTWTSGQKYKISLNYLNDKSFYINDAFITSVNKNGDITDSTIHLFKLNDPTTTFTQYINAKLFSVKISEGNEIKMNLVPCSRKVDSKPGMCDILTNEFYTNKGAGNDFIPGPVIKW